MRRIAEWANKIEKQIFTQQFYSLFMSEKVSFRIIIMIMIIITVELIVTRKS